MDSITHTLYRAISVDDAHQRSQDNPLSTIPSQAGLQPLTVRKDVHEAYLDAAGTDLHIELERGPELLGLYLEFVAAGFTPPVSLIDGATVILSPGQVSLFAICDHGNATWMASLAVITRPAPGAESYGPVRKAGWSEQVG